MERAAQILEQLKQPAFLVSDGMIVCANKAAIQRQIPVNTAISSLIATGEEDYAAFSQGKLSLSLDVAGRTYVATVTALDDCQIFLLDSDYEAPELQAYALAAQQLREPLTAAMASAQQLLQNDTPAYDDADKKHIAQINRGLYQMLRLVGNMSDSPLMSREAYYQMRSQDAIWVIDDILQKACALAEQAGRRIRCHVPNIGVSTLLDPDQLERAVLNLISNALKNSPADSEVAVHVSYRNNRLCLTVENEPIPGQNVNQEQLFSGFLREPGMENNQSRLGLGMLIVRRIAAIHGGTVLAEQPQNGRFRITMTISVKNCSDSGLHSPVRLPVDYAGGFDHAIVELSDILPASMFEEKL